MKIFLSIALSLITFIANAQVIGKWKTIDDETGRAKSVVEIYEQNGKLYGKITDLFRESGEEQNPMCEKCTDDRKDKPVRGMVILRDMQRSGNNYKSGTICDPKKGSVYRCELWLDENDKNSLQVRGYWGIFYRTQTWKRMN